MEALRTTLEWVQNVTFLLVGAWAFRRWVQRRTEQSWWLAATFGALVVVLGGGFVIDALPAVEPVLGRVLIAALAAFPYLLLRFLDSFERVPTWFRAAVLAATAVAILAGVTVPAGEGDARGPGFVLLLVAFAVVWVGTLPVVAVRFWWAGRGQPTLVRRRLRTLAVAAAGLGMALLLVIGRAAGSAAADGDEVTAFSIVVQVLAVLAAGSFLIGFAPPGPLKSSWRQAEEHALHRASVGLMGATTPQQVADLLVPHVRDVIAARGAALVHDDAVLGEVGVTEEEVADVRSGRAETTAYPLSNGALYVWTNDYTPFFGEDELELLQRLAVLTDLALARTDLLASERFARVELEKANADLESFVYSASHDLKSPLIAIQSFLDVLAEEAAGDLDERARFYIQRMRSNAVYMEALVGDLLELSRVGRVETTPEVVDLAELVHEVASQVEDRFPRLRVHVVGDLPSLWLNPLRGRQLFRNLVENAATHGGEDLQVWVEARPTEEAPGGVVVYVRDDGEGIPDAYRERIFGVFERLNTDASSASTGIGLAICRKIAETVGGRIWVTDHDGGAEFAILFPPAAVARPSHDHQRTTDTGVPA